MKLTVELEKGDNPEVAICFDGEGLELLMSKLEWLRKRVDHIHLMTPAWAGRELTQEKFGGDKYDIVNSLRLVSLPKSK